MDIKLVAYKRKHNLLHRQNFLKQFEDERKLFINDNMVSQKLYFISLQQYCQCRLIF